MKTVVVLFFVSLGLFVVGWYYASIESPLDAVKLQEYAKENNILPNDWEKLNEGIISLINEGVITNYLSTNAYIEATILLSGISCIFAAIHMVVDKLFFKNFYEGASLIVALRRGIFLSLAIFLSLLLKLYLLEIYYILLVPLLILLIEIIITKFITKDFMVMVKKLDDRIKKSEEQHA